MNAMTPIRTRTMSIQRALEWAFGAEKAQIDFDQYEAHEFERVGVDPIWRGMKMAELGCAVDGGGTSDPHSDAVIIASVVERVLSRQMALTVAELARAGTAPEWRVDATRRIVPLRWDMRNDGIWLAETKYLPEQNYIDRKSRKKTYRPEICPITYAGGAVVIGQARRAYLEWIDALLTLAVYLRSDNVLMSVKISDEMPPMSPWCP